MLDNCATCLMGFYEPLDWNNHWWLITGKTAPLYSHSFTHNSHLWKSLLTISGTDTLIQFNISLTLCLVFILPCLGKEMPILKHIRPHAKDKETVVLNSFPLGKLEYFARNPSINNLGPVLPVWTIHFFFSIHWLFLLCTTFFLITTNLMTLGFFSTPLILWLSYC